MSQTVHSIQKAKTQFSELVTKAQKGEEVLIGAYGKPQAKLVSVDFEQPVKKVVGLMKGQIKIPEDFDAPLRDEELAHFNNI